MAVKKTSSTTRSKSSIDLAALRKSDPDKYKEVVANNKAKIKAMSEKAAAARAKNPALQAKYDARMAENAKKSAARKQASAEKSAARKQASAEKSAARKQAADTKLSQTAGYQKWSSKNTGGSVSDYRSALNTKMKDMSEKGFQRWQASNPGGSRSDYNAYARQRVKDMAAKAKARKSASGS